MEKIRWGIIGCGDVTELKSGPAFNKVPDSQLVAVMRRNADKAKDYAQRHNVPKWYSDAGQLINDPDINAIYVATPPSSHEAYSVAAMEAGKPVYLEKPMTVDTASAWRIADAVKKTGQKLVVAHYRREQPLFGKIKQLVKEEAIGKVRFAHLSLYKQALSEADLKIEKTAWRVDPATAGGGLFNDLSPHQLDLMYYFFGEPEKVIGISGRQGTVYPAVDIVAGNIVFKSGTFFNGLWSFTASPADEKEECEIIGERGSIRFSFFEHKPVQLVIDGKPEMLYFDPLMHVQQPMIEATVNYFLGRGPNPDSAEEGVKVMEMIDRFTGKE